jgi:hypothetical protein
MGSGAVIYVPSFIKICSCVQKLIGGIHRHTHQRDLISLHLFFQSKENMLMPVGAIGAKTSILSKTSLPVRQITKSVGLPNNIRLRFQGNAKSFVDDKEYAIPLHAFSHFFSPSLYFTEYFERKVGH